MHANTCEPTIYCPGNSTPPPPTTHHTTTTRRASPPPLCMALHAIILGFDSAAGGRTPCSPFHDSSPGFGATFCAVRPPPPALSCLLPPNSSAHLAVSHSTAPKYYSHTAPPNSILFLQPPHWVVAVQRVAGSLSPTSGQQSWAWEPPIVLSPPPSRAATNLDS